MQKLSGNWWWSRWWPSKSCRSGRVSWKRMVIRRHPPNRGSMWWHSPNWGPMCWHPSQRRSMWRNLSVRRSIWWHSTNRQHLANGWSARRGMPSNRWRTSSCSIVIGRTVPNPVSSVFKGRYVSTRLEVHVSWFGYGKIVRWRSSCRLSIPKTSTTQQWCWQGIRLCSVYLQYSVV